MRRTHYLVVILLLIAQTSFGQIYQNMAQPGYKFSRARFDSVLTIPTGTAALRNITGGRDTGQIRYVTSDSSLYVYTGSQWEKVSGSGGSGVTVTSYGKNATRDSTILLLSDGTRYAAKDSSGGGGIDSTLLSDSLALKQNISDTAAMLSPYARQQALVDTAAAIRSKVLADSLALAGGASKWTQSGIDIYRLLGNVGIGVDTPYSKLEIQANGLGATPPDSASLILANKTPAASGSQQSSPSLVFEGQGWKTTATAASQAVEWRFRVLPFQSAANPGSKILMEYRINKGTWFQKMESNSGTGLTVFSNQVASDGFFAPVFTATGGFLSANAGYTTNSTMLLLSGTNTRKNFSNGTSTMANTGGTNTLVIFDNQSVINNTGGTNTYIGFYHAPTLTSLTGTTHYAFWNTTGTNALNSTSGSTAIGGTTPDASAKLDIQSTTQGVLFPRMTTSQKNAIPSPAAGLQVYDTTLNQMSYYNGTAWVNF